MNVDFAKTELMSLDALRRGKMPSLKLFFKMDVPKVGDGSNALFNQFKWAYVLNIEKYHHLKELGIELDCKSLEYTPRVTEKDGGYVVADLIPIETLLSIIDEWEKDVVETTPVMRKVNRLAERTIKHHLNLRAVLMPQEQSFSNDKVHEDMILVRVCFDTDPISSCTPTKMSKHLRYKPWWQGNFHDSWKDHKDLWVKDIDEVDDKMLGDVEKELAEGINYRMKLVEARLMLGKKLQDVKVRGKRPLEADVQLIDANVNSSDPTDKRTKHLIMVRVLKNGPNCYNSEMVFHKTFEEDDVKGLMKFVEDFNPDDFAKEHVPSNVAVVSDAERSEERKRQKERLAVYNGYIDGWAKYCHEVGETFEVIEFG
jgi:hypothetical protein